MCAVEREIGSCWAREVTESYHKFLVFAHPVNHLRMNTWFVDVCRLALSVFSHLNAVRGT